MVVLTVIAVKGIVMASLFTLTFLASLLPLKLASSNSDSPIRRHRVHIAKSLLSCFAAGVFLATSFLDLLPGAEQQMAKVISVFALKTSFPLAEFATAMGFFLILLVEQIVVMVKERQASNEELRPLVDDDFDVRRTQFRPRSRSGGSVSSVGSIEGIQSTAGSRRGRYRGRHASAQQSGEEEEEEDISHPTYRSLILLLAISVHSVFEGMAIGLQETKTDVLGVFVALSLHKGILAFSLGLQLSQSNLARRSFFKACFTFAIASPIGTGIGMIVQHLGDSKHRLAADAVLQGIACGTFLYVTFFEVLPHEFNDPQGNRLLKVLCLLIGFGAVTAILFADPDMDKPACVMSPATTAGPHLTPSPHSLL